MNRNKPSSEDVSGNGRPASSQHFDADYQDEVAVIGLEPIELVAGTLPRRQLRLVEAGAELHQEELLADRERLQAGQLPLPIAPLESAEMPHPLFRVIRFQIVRPFVLRVGFNDGTEQNIAFQPILRGEMFGPWFDLAMCKQVTIDPEVHTLVWPHGADLDPATLHDWPKHADAFAARAKTWGTQTVGNRTGGRAQPLL